MKKYCLYSLIFLSFISIFILHQFSSQDKETNTTKNSIWILTEDSVSDGMIHQIRTAISNFESEHPDILIQLDILPTDSGDRTTYISKIYNLISDGGGPDIYVLPTDSVIPIEQPQKYTYVGIEPFFHDVNQAMRDGYFLDINKWYLFDIGLDKGQLNSTVMDAGVIDGSRYVLPLRYDAPILYIWDDYFHKYRVNIDAASTNIDDLMQFAIENNDSILACGSEYISMQAFTDIIDYDTNDVTLNCDTLVYYLQLQQQLQTIIGDNYKHRSSADLSTYVSGLWTQSPVQINTLGNALAYTAIANAENQQLTALPLRSIDGEYIATVKYYTAISANCKNPDIAYNFIRILLQSDYQWELNRKKPESSQYNGIINRSWPVRYKNSVEPLWSNYRNQSKKNYENSISQQRQNKLQTITLNDKNLPILFEEIDVARFPVYLNPSFSTYIARLNNYEKDYEPTTINLDTLAEQIINNLKPNINK